MLELPTAKENSNSTFENSGRVLNKTNIKVHGGSPLTFLDDTLPEAAGWSW